MSMKLDAKVIGVEKLNASLADVFKGLKGDSIVKVGILSGSNARNDGAETNAAIGFKQEFGSITENIPARSFLRMPLEMKSKEIVSDLKTIKANDKKNVLTLVDRLCTKLGMVCEGYIMDAFASRGFGQWKPNSPVTIALKGSDSPLIDSGELRRSITSVVVKNGK